jgi:hypothetical protein
VALRDVSALGLQRKAEAARTERVFKRRIARAYLKTSQARLGLRYLNAREVDDWCAAVSACRRPKWSPMVIDVKWEAAGFQI